VGVTTPIEPLLVRGDKLPASVKSPKTSAAYQAHSYPTKIPPEAITPFIEASCAPGAVVLDPFCGSGMTGVAALSVGRSAVLSDLSPGAVHLARNHTRPVDPAVLLTSLAALDRVWMVTTEKRLYGTTCPRCGGEGVTRHTIWSDVHACPSCHAEVRLWDLANEADGHVPRSVACPVCHTLIGRAGNVPLRSEPAHLVVACQNGCGKLQAGPVTGEEATRLAAIAGRPLRHWVPTDPIAANREMYKRSALHLRGIETVRDFYLPRAKVALGKLWMEIGKVERPDIREALQFAFTNTAWHGSRMRRYNARGGQRPLSGTLYIPQLIAEANVFEVFRHQVEQVAAFHAHQRPDSHAVATVRQSSAAHLGWLADHSIDYVFTDPPFGSNIFYADCNIVWEAWLGQVTDEDAEMVVNRSRTAADGGKSVTEYGQLLEQAFREMRRVVHPQGRVSVVFHNSDDLVWGAMLQAAEDAGLRQVQVSIIDKVQRSMKGYKGRSGQELVPFYDLVITFSPSAVVLPHLNGAGDLAAAAVTTHLKTLNGHPVHAERNLDYLYSMAVSSVIRQGARPDGLSFRAFEALCDQRFRRQGTAYYIK